MQTHKSWDSKGTQLIHALFTEGEYIFNYEDAITAAQNISKKALVQSGKIKAVKAITEGIICLGGSFISTTTFSSICNCYTAYRILRN